MKTRRTAMGLLGAAFPAWALARSLSQAVALDDPAIEVRENIYIPMADGARLAARLFLPAHAAARPAGAVLEYLPYRKRDGYRYRDDIVGPFLAKAGIALVRVDIRGTGESDGVIIDEYEPIEQADGLAVIAWIARQPWCNGRVGMRGISYGSFTALQAAAQAPPALRAIVSACGTEQRYYDDVHYRGGCLIEQQFEWAMEWQVVMRAPPDPAIVGAAWRDMWRQRLAASGPVALNWTEHQTLDATWRHGSTQDYGKIRCAVFNVGAMLDSYINSAVRMMERAPQVPQRALIGPWAHKWPGYPDPPGHIGAPSDAANGNPGPGVDWLPVEALWWRHWLLGEANGIMDEPRFWAFREELSPVATYPKDTPGQFVSEPTWPSPRLVPVVLHLNADGLSAAAGAARLLEHRTNLTIGFANRVSDSSGDPRDWWRDQAGDDALCLTFDTAVLDAPFDLMGQPEFVIRVRADRPVAKLCLRVTEVMADGRSYFVSYGVLNLTHRDGDAAPAALQPGHDYDVRFRGQFAAYRFRAGTRIRVALSETWWPEVWPSPELVVLHVTAGVSHVVLPRRPAEAIDPVLPFALYHDRYVGERAVPEGRLDGVVVSGPPGRRVFTLEEGSTEVKPEPVAGTGTVYGEAYRLRRVIREDDPNSAEMEAEAINTYARGAWQVRLRAWTRCRSTPTHFDVAESFEAWDGGVPVFERKWEKRIPRALV